MSVRAKYLGMYVQHVQHVQYVQHVQHVQYVRHVQHDVQYAIPYTHHPFVCAKIRLTLFVCGCRCVVVFVVLLRS